MAKRLREKAEARKENADKRPSATAKYVRISPDKVRIVLDVIRGKNYTEALAILKFTRKAACEPLIKLLNSAAANAENNLNMSKNELVRCGMFCKRGSDTQAYQSESKGQRCQNKQAYEPHHDHPR